MSNCGQFERLRGTWREIQYSFSQAFIAGDKNSMTKALKHYSPVFISVVITRCEQSHGAIVSPKPAFPPENRSLCMEVFVFKAI